MQRYTSEDKFIMQLGYAKATKSGNTVSGDSSIQIKLEDDKYLTVLSDGMGSGMEARKSSQIVIKMMKKLLSAGFDKEDSLELINSTIKLSTEEVYATIDASIFDLYNGNVEFIKNGSCKTYIKNKQNIDVVNSNSLPLGILNNVEFSVFDRDINDGDIFVMCSDGIIDSKEEEQTDKWFMKVLKNISTNNVQKMADILLNEAIDNNYGIIEKNIARMNNTILLRETVDNNTGDYAKTEYDVISRNTNLNYTVVKVLLHTGKTHQIRVHMIDIGHILLGDTLYADYYNIKNIDSLISRQALHAAKVSFNHPITNEPIVVTADLPNDMKNLIN